MSELEGRMGILEGEKGGSLRRRGGIEGGV